LGDTTEVQLSHQMLQLGVSGYVHT
jgi:hypothetical protein